MLIHKKLEINYILLLLIITSIIWNNCDTVYCSTPELASTVIEEIVNTPANIDPIEEILNTPININLIEPTTVTENSKFKTFETYCFCLWMISFVTYAISIGAFS